MFACVSVGNYLILKVSIRTKFPFQVYVAECKSKVNSNLNIYTQLTYMYVYVRTKNYCSVQWKWKKDFYFVLIYICYFVFSISSSSISFSFWCDHFFYSLCLWFVVECEMYFLAFSMLPSSKFQFNQQPKKIFIFNSNVHCFDKYTRLIRECVYEIYIHLAKRRTYNDYLVFGFFKWFALIYTAVCYDEDQVEINKLYGCIQYVLLCIILHI